MSDLTIDDVIATIPHLPAQFEEDDDYVEGPFGTFSNSLSRLQGDARRIVIEEFRNCLLHGTPSSWKFVRPVGRYTTASGGMFAHGMETAREMAATFRRGTPNQRRDLAGYLKNSMRDHADQTPYPI